MHNVADHAMRVTLAPSFESRDDMMNGKIAPPTDFPAQMVPYAIPLRAMNHSSRYRVVGENSKPDPIAHITPWDAINCQSWVANDDKMRETMVRNKPSGPAYGRRNGYRVRKVNVMGIMRYMTPFSVVPTTATDPGETWRNGDVGEEV